MDARAGTFDWIDILAFCRVAACPRSTKLSGAQRSRIRMWAPLLATVSIASTSLGAQTRLAVWTLTSQPLVVINASKDPKG